MNGIQPVAVYFIGADRDDLACLRDVEQGGVIALEATIIVLNEAHAYVETAGIRDDLKGYLFPGTSRGRRGNWLSEEPMTQTDAWRIVRGRRSCRDRRADPLPHIPGDRHHDSMSRRGWAVSFSATDDSSQESFRPAEHGIMLLALEVM